jgi:flavin-dependent dehydrogenase
MSQKNTKKLAIVGGGSAGWMTAMYLNKLFNHDEKVFDITVIESPDIGVIGVGEATVHSVRFFFAALGINEAELLRETNATLKTGILFRNWRKPENGKTHEYFHPFEHQQSTHAVDINSAWFLSGKQKCERFDQSVSLSSALIAQGKGPKTPASKPYQGVVPYGYHIDAILMSRYLRKLAVADGVTHVEATISDVNVDDGNITSVQAGDQSYSADFFIDCTGFRGVLMEKLKQGNWESFEKALPCNRAVALQRELPEGHTPNPYTVSTAMKHGWTWQIDLVNRQGTGYVYDGRRISKDQAEADLREYLGPESSVLKCVHLDMKVGCRNEFWVGNCIAIGLSGGFIEPLESTGLHLINLGAGLLATHLPVANPDQSVRDSYNRLMRGFFQDLKQFVVLHYCLSNRDDSEFWRNAPSTVDECPWLAKQLDVWKHKVCEFHDLAGSFSTIFGDDNYRYILYGMQHYPELQGVISNGMSEAIFDRVRHNAASAVNAAMPHDDYLRQLNQ